MPETITVEVVHDYKMTCDRADYLRFCLETNFTKLRVNIDGYVVFNSSSKRDIRYHRWILGDPKGLVEHIDGDKRNNCNSNLRVTTNSFNMHNLNDKLISSNTSGFRGISWISSRKRWCASIKINGKQTNLGFFHSKENAIAARHKADLSLKETIDAYHAVS